MIEIKTALSILVMQKKIRSTPTLKEEAHPQQYIFKNTEKILLFSVFCCKEYIHQDQSLCTNNH